MHAHTWRELGSSALDGDAARLATTSFRALSRDWQAPMPGAGVEGNPGVLVTSFSGKSRCTATVFS